MSAEIKAESILTFLKKNWFKLSVIALVLYVWFKKDITFQVSFDGAEKAEERASPPKEKLTDAAPALSDQAAVVDKMELPFIGNEGGNRQASSEFAVISEDAKQAYLKRFAKVAIAEQQKFDIPASVILGIALYHSAAGKRDFALEANNQFALPCRGHWKGECATYQGIRYRRYESAWASFRDFSLFVEQNFAYLKGSGYKTWAIGLEKAGFAQQANFSKDLIALIENYGLQQLDR